MKTKELIKNNLNTILKYYDLPKPEPKKHTVCKMCGKKSFRLTNYRGYGEFICVCGTGNLFDLLERCLGIPFKQACKEIDELLDNQYNHEPKPRSANDENYDRAMQIAKYGRNIKGTNVQAYLNSRGIYNLPERGLFIDSEQNMVAIAVNHSGKPSYMHTTYLHNGKKADVPVQKKVQKLNDVDGDGCVVRLSELKSTLFLAEGIESALSVSQIYKGASCWATLNSGNLAKFRLPTKIDTLIVFCDNDAAHGEGLAKGMACINANLKQGLCRKGIVRWADEPNYDANDFLNGMCGVYELAFGQE